MSESAHVLTSLSRHGEEYHLCDKGMPCSNSIEPRAHGHQNHIAQNMAVNLGQVQAPCPHHSACLRPTCRWMFTWMLLLAITVAYQRRKKEAGKMKAKWEKMKEIDEEKASGHRGKR